MAWRGGGAQQAAVLEHHLHLSAEQPRARDSSVAEAMHLEQRVARADELHRGARTRVRQREDARVCQVGAACHENAHGHAPGARRKKAGGGTGHRSNVMLGAHVATQRPRAPASIRVSTPPPKKGAISSGWIRGERVLLLASVRTPVGVV